MFKFLDPKYTWWWWRPVQNRLITWTQVLLGKRAGEYRVVLEEGDWVGYEDSENRIIKVNPQSFKEENPATQFKLTQAILGHEIGHALFTNAWPEQPVLQQTVNMLEDERIEAAMQIKYPGLYNGFRDVEQMLLNESEPFDDQEPEHQAYMMMLIWRFGWHFNTEEELFDRFQLSEKGIDHWHEIKPLVEKCWSAATTTQVIELAKRILEILGIPPEKTLVGLPGWFGKVVPSDTDTQKKTDGVCIPFPEDVDAESGGITLSSPPDLVGHGLGNSGDVISLPAPYTAIEDKVHHSANQLAERLKLPQPDVRLEPHDIYGRYNPRQDTRTPDTPNLYQAARGESSHGLALYLLADRSGSMCYREKDMRKAMMMVYLACTNPNVQIPIGIGYFGNDDHAKNNLTLEVTPPRTAPNEEVKALIAGFEGTTGAEYLDWGLAQAEAALLGCRERKKVLLVLHDGVPVWKDRGITDFDLSLHHIRRLNSVVGITTIGIFLTDGSESDGKMVPKLQLLFGNQLITCNIPQLATRLGEMIINVA